MDEPTTSSWPDIESMGSLLAELVPFVVGLAVTPAAITIGILLLGSKHPVANPSAFAAAFAIAYGILSAVVLAAPVRPQNH